ncbi:tripartite tricarboxylate transporter substrate-binding protein [Sulfitobacter porphyrae]|uniref:Tripartite tricarboxylate transporter substrate-binding protein n=1 Tax=Sulfitobacter porphyrae TaxID=1246864 RepID=A0ABW2B9W3_9RHOB
MPFGAAEMVSNTLGGHLDMMYEEYGPTRGLIESGDLIPLLLFSDDRLAELPDVPTAKELGYDVTIGRWRGFGIKPDTNAADVETLVALFRDAAADPGYKKIEAENALQYRSEFIGPEAFKTFLDGEIATYTQIMKQLGY